MVGATSLLAVMKKGSNMMSESLAEYSRRCA